MQIFSDNTEAIGKTPLVKLTKIVPEDGNNYYGKVEGRNPAYSVKCRVGVSLMKDAINSGKLKKGMTVVEPTSGNTGIGLAFAGAVLGYKVCLVMPESMSEERKMMMKAFGAELVLTAADRKMIGAVETAEKMAADEPDKYYLPQQFKNPANPLAHELTTGPEIWKDTDGSVDMFVSAIGTGGTISGTGKYLKSKKDVLCVGVEPAGSPVITQKLNGEEIKPGAHTIQGIGAGFIPETLNLNILDEIMTVTDEEAFAKARELAAVEGVICGISSGAAVCGAIKAAEKLSLKNKNIVIILPDSGERYLSSGLFKF